MKYILAFLFIFAIILAEMIFIRHERRQDSEIRKLRDELNLLRAKTENNSEAESFTRNCLTGEGQNYLAIGNSITLHTTCNYWWANCGMAASEPSKDYFHLVTEELRKHNYTVNSCVCSSYVWEIITHDRYEALTLIDSYLNENINIITIQLGENVSDLSNFESDYTYLINHIKQK